MYDKHNLSNIQAKKKAINNGEEFRSIVTKLS